MKRKTFPKKLALNKTTIATLSSDDLKKMNGGIVKRTLVDCFLTNYPNWPGCPETMTLCGVWYCP